MSKLAAMQAAIAAASVTAADMTEVQKGGGGGRLLPQGYAFGRLVEVVELGNQPQEYQGQAKDPKAMVQLGFALWGEGYTNEDGTPYIMRLFPFSIDRNEKAKAYLLFKALNWKGTANNFGQLLSEAFLVKIVHEPKSKADSKTIVSRIDLKGFLPPLDPVTRMPYSIPEPSEDLFKWFFWDQPTLETWNSLHIAGNLDDGRSKNFVQEQIAGATNFAGSALETLLLTNGLTKPVAAAKPTAATPIQPALPNGVGVQGSPSVPVHAGTPVNTMGSVGTADPVQSVSGGVGSVPLAQPAVSSQGVVVPVVAPVIPGLGFTGLPASPVIPVTTSHSSPALPS